MIAKVQVSLYIIHFDTYFQQL